VRRTYRYRLYPTRNQVAALEHQLGQACDLYNAALEHRRTMWRDHGEPVGFYAQCAELRELRATGLMDATANAWSQMDVLRRVDRAFDAFFRRVKAGETPGHPRFRSRRRYDSLTWQVAGGKGGGCHIRDGRLALQGVGHVKVRWHRDLPETAPIKVAQVKRSASGWYACFLLDGVATKPLRQTGRAVGIDLGISTFAALSTGEMIDGPRAERSGAAAVRRAQRKVARRDRGSNRRAKAVRLLARQRERQASRRRDHAHKTARMLIERYDLIAIEDLNLRGLAKGMLARDCNDQGWGRFVALLSEKAEEAARELVLVDPKNTSQTCSACGAHVPKALGVRVHSCACGYVADRDVNAARNVLALGLRRSLQAPTVGEEVRAVA
jgi:putative transposase